MKVAQVSATFPPYMAGTGNVCYYYALGLAQLGHDVTVFTSRYPDEDYSYPDSIEVKRFRPLFRIGNASFLPQLLTLKDYDIIHLHYPFFFGGELIYFLKRLKGEKYVITYHNDVVASGLKGLFFKLHQRAIARKIIKNAEKICATSLDYVEHSDIKAFVEMEREKFVEIPNGVDTNWLYPGINGEEIKLRHGIGDKRVILFVGALDEAHYFKGVDVLLKSFSKIGDNDSCMLLIGDGNLRNYYMKVSKELGIADRTVFTGNVSNEELPNYYAASDLVVLPSVTRGEAFGLVLVEAMAAGKPVIASDLPGVRTVVDDGFNGFLVKPKHVDELASKIEYLLENEEVRKRFGREGRRKVEERYSWAEIVRKLEEVYKEVICGSLLRN